MKYYVADMNGMCTDLKVKLAGHLTTPREADVWIVWQDCQGSYCDLIRAAKQYYNKPVYVVQHGRRASWDYGPINRYKLYADKFLCWGKKDYESMLSYGYPKERLSIIGCPLNPHIKPKVNHDEKVVLFIPVSTGKEEPENLQVYYELIKLKYSKAQIKLFENRKPLSDKWGADGKHISFNSLSQDMDVIAKLLPWHDRPLYHGSVLTGYQDDPQNNERLFNLLANVDCVVGLDEGTSEIFAFAHDVPVVIVDGFKYRQFEPDGRKYVSIDPYITGAANHVPLEKLGEAINTALEHPEHLREERAKVAELEMGVSCGNPVDNIIRIVKEDMKNYVKA